MSSFFRRCAWSPDGSLLVATAGIFKDTPDSEIVNTVYLFGRGRLSEAPLIHLPGHKKPCLSVRFSPILYKLKPLEDGVKPMIDLPYNMIFAVVTLNSVVIYETQQPNPIAMLSNLHYAPLTDLAWTGDGQNMMISSVDGFCSLVTFDSGELGLPLVEPVKATVSNDVSIQGHSGEPVKIEFSKDVVMQENEPIRSIQDKENCAGNSNPLTNPVAIKEVLTAAVPEMNTQTTSIVNGGKKRIMPVFLGPNV